MMMFGDHEGKITATMITCCIIAAMGGFMFGYDVGFTGGVTSVDSFMTKFFPQVYEGWKKDMVSNYCKQEKREIKLFLSCLFFGGVVATLLSSYTSRRFGRKVSIVISGLFYLVGIILSTTTQDLGMLMIGRTLFGCGIGFAYQAVPIYLSEIAPTRIRGAINILFRLNITIGILLSNLANYGTKKIKGEWSWRLLLGLNGIPATIFTIGSFFIVETPNSLIERGHLEKGKQVLRKIRGTHYNINVEPELLELVEASRTNELVIKQYYLFRNLFTRRNRPQLVIAMSMQIFQSLTGIDVIIFYVPIFLNTIGYDRYASYSAVIAGVLNVISTLVSMYFVDKIGRRKLLVEASVHMFLSHILIAMILGTKVKDHDSNDLSYGLAIFVVILVCTFVSSYAWSWGPLGLLIPSEIFPLEIRSEGQSVSVLVNFLFTLPMIQAFFPMLCSLKFGIFLFFSSWILFMSFFIFFFLPETKNIPIEDMRDRVWKRHWYWKKFLDD